MLGEQPRAGAALQGSGDAARRRGAVRRGRRPALRRAHGRRSPPAPGGSATTVCSPRAAAAAEPRADSACRRVRTYVRVDRGDDPARRPRRVLRVGRAARRPAAARAAGDRRRRASCWRRATRPRRTASARRWAGGVARRLCPHAIVVAPRMSAYSEASKAVFRVFDDTAPLVEGLSIDEAFLDVRGLERIAGTPVEIARAAAPGGARAGRPADHGRRRADEVPRQGGERRGQARRPAGRAARRRARVPAPAAGRAALGRRAGDGGQAARPRASRRSARWRRWARRRSSRCSGAASGRHLHALAHNRDPRPVQVGRRRGSIGSQRALGRRPRSPEAIDATLVGLVDRVTRRMRAAGRVGRTVVLRLRFGDFTRATRSHTLPRATGRDAADPRRRARPARRRDADDRAPRAHAGRRGRRQPRRRPRRPADAAVRPPQRRRARRGARRGARALRLRARSPGPCCSAATRA